MEPEGSLPHSQEPTTCPYPQPYGSIPCPPSPLSKIHLNIIFSSTPGSFKWPSSLRFPTKTLYAPLSSHIRATCPVHLSVLDLYPLSGLWNRYDVRNATWWQKLLPRCNLEYIVRIERFEDFQKIKNSWRVPIGVLCRRPVMGFERVYVHCHNVPVVFLVQKWI